MPINKANELNIYFSDIFGVTKSQLKKYDAFNISLLADLPLFVVGIPMKVVSDSDLIPVTCSEVKPGVFGAKRRWRSYRA